MQFDQLKREFANNPLAVIAVGSMAVTALAKVLDSAGSVRSKNAYARAYNRKSAKK